MSHLSPFSPLRHFPPVFYSTRHTRSCRSIPTCGTPFQLFRVGGGASPRKVPRPVSSTLLPGGGASTPRFVRVVRMNRATFLFSRSLFPPPLRPPHPRGDRHQTNLFLGSDPLTGVILRSPRRPPICIDSSIFSLPPLPSQEGPGLPHAFVFPQPVAASSLSMIDSGPRFALCFCCLETLDFAATFFLDRIP